MKCDTSDTSELIDNFTSLYHTLPPVKRFPWLRYSKKRHKVSLENFYSVFLQQKKEWNTLSSLYLDQSAVQRNTCWRFFLIFYNIFFMDIFSEYEFVALKMFACSNRIRRSRIPRVRFLISIWFAIKKEIIFGHFENFLGSGATESSAI